MGITVILQNGNYLHAQSTSRKETICEHTIVPIFHSIAAAYYQYVNNEEMRVIITDSSHPNMGGKSQ